VLADFISVFENERAFFGGHVSAAASGKLFELFLG
jgi:hypothetical protein